MKKLLLSTLSLMVSLSALAQTKSVQNFVREMPCTDDLGQVIATQMGTIVLPYAPMVEGATLYELKSASATEWVFSAVANPQANTPYVFVVNEGATDVYFYGEGAADMQAAPVASAAGVEGAFVGSYKRQVIRKKIYYISNDRLNTNDDRLVMSTPYRAYFDGSILPDGTELAEDVKLTFINTLETGLENVGKQQSAITISTQNISLQPGTYTINGQKAEVK
ncbi:MAG: hypothetical protein MJZ15_11890 [Bacteroidales bacterium]|nr:hypothetical protein [Bacteroidales bacterium]